MTSNNINSENIKWPPTEEQIKTIASSALNTSKKNDVKVLVYWLNDPNLMILDPIHHANTEYIRMKFEVGDSRSVLVEVGKID